MIDPETLKLLNLLSPGGDTSNLSPAGLNPPMTNQQPQMNPGLDDQIAQMLQPKDEQFDRLAQLVQNIPQRNQYAPSLGRRIAGFAAGLGTGGPVGIAGGQPIGYRANVDEGLKLQQGINDMPYNRAVNDWLLQEKPTEELAKLENTRNVNQRVAALGLRGTQLREEGLQRQRNWDSTRAADLEEKQKNAAERTEISRQRADAYRYDKEHPNHQYKEDSEGFVYSIDPKSNQTEYLFDGDGNKIKSKNLSDEMKMKIRHDYTMNEIGARGNQARQTEIVRQSGRESLEGTKQANREKTATGGGKPESESQKKVGNYNRAQQAYNTRPDWAPYIHLSPGNNFTVAMPEGGNQKTFNDVYRAIYKSEPSTGARSVMYAPDGKPVTVPIENVDKAEAAGYSYSNPRKPRK